MNRRSLDATAIALLLTTSAGPALGHHSATMFDQEREVTLLGVVERVDWVNPHVYVHVAGTTADGNEATWAVEGGPPNVMTRNGWSRETIVAGESVVVTAYPPRNPRGTTVLGKTLLTDDGVTLDLEESGQPSSLRGPASSEPMASEDLNGRWLTEWNFATASPFLQTEGLEILTGEAQEAVANYNGLVNPGRECVSQTVPFVMIWPALHVIEIGDEVTTIRSDWGERTVYMNRDSHDGATASNQGHSIGRWDGDTLVVDTTHFSNHRIGIARGVPSGPGKHLVERFSLSPDRTRITYAYEVVDDEVLTEPMVGTIQLVHRPDLELVRIPCDPESAARYLEVR